MMIAIMAIIDMKNANPWRWAAARPSTVTPLLKRLERDGLLRRGRDPVDERHLRVELTDEGHALRRRAGAARERIVCALGGTEEPIQALKREIDRVTALLERPESA